jgi:hypothetical protein
MWKDKNVFFNISRATMNIFQYFKIYSRYLAKILNHKVLSHKIYTDWLEQLV